MELELESELELELEPLKRLCSLARCSFTRLGQVGQVADDSCSREGERERWSKRERERERWRVRTDCGGALMWVQLQCKHNNKG